MDIHVVTPGETVTSIARDYGVSVSRIISDNGLKAPVRLVVGQTLVIQYPLQVYTVNPGDTVYSVAEKFNLTPNAIYRNNPGLFARDVLYPGQTIVISYTGQKKGVMSVNGYAYPYVNLDLLRTQMPYSTFLTPFTYGFNTDGTLVDLNDAALIGVADNFGVGALMHLSTLTPQGNFSNELASSIFADEAARNNLVENVLDTMRRKGYIALDIDFEFVLPEDADNYVAFVRQLTDRLNPQGYEVIVALAPKTSDNQRGVLYEGHDYQGLSGAANAVFLMTYEWGYTYGPPMAVSPIESMRAVLDYAITRIPPDKIYMGMPNYGYDWTLPFVRGESRATSISNEYAVELARRYGAEILFDDYAYAPHFNYTDEQGRIHEVWFDDAKSIQARLALVPEYGFLGVGYWNFMRPFYQNWLVLNAEYDIRQGITP